MGEDSRTSTQSGTSGATSLAMFGDGSDGNVTISTTVTLTRDMFYDTLTIANGGTLLPDGYRVFCKTALIVQAGGVLHRDGTNAVNNGAGAGSGANVRPLGYSAFSGPNGGTGAGSAGSGITGIGGAGGTGGSGNGGANAGGAGGAVTAPGGQYGASYRFPAQAVIGTMFGQVNASPSSQVINPGTHGGAGGGDGTNNGGGGGGPASVIVIAALSVNNAGRISANGGAGGQGGGGGAAGNCGGGGGGGGGVVIVVYNTYTGTAPTATGGAGGAKSGTGVAGSAGSDGKVVLLGNS